MTPMADAYLISADTNIVSRSTPKKTEWNQDIPAEHLSSWQIGAIKAVLRISSLQDNWDSYGSPSPSGWIVDLSVSLIRSINNDEFPVPNVVPVPGGGIQFEFTSGPKELELCVMPDRSLEVLQVEHGEPVNEIELRTYPQLYSLLAWLNS